jgi:hypothetical protein
LEKADLSFGFHPVVLNADHQFTSLGFSVSVGLAAPYEFLAVPGFWSASAGYEAEEIILHTLVCELDDSQGSPEPVHLT